MGLPNDPNFSCSVWVFLDTADTSVPLEILFVIEKRVLYVELMKSTSRFRYGVMGVSQMTEAYVEA